MQEHIPAYRLQLLDFHVKEPEILRMPVAINFCTASTTAGVLVFKDTAAAAQPTCHPALFNWTIDAFPTTLTFRPLTKTIFSATSNKKALSRFIVNLKMLTAFPKNLFRRSSKRG